MEKAKTPAKEGDEKVKPDEGHGGKGTFGEDGDYNSANDKGKKAKRRNSIVTIKEAK